MPQSTAQTQKLTKKQRKGLAFRQKLGKNRKAGKLGDPHSENAPVPESGIVNDEEDLEASENINPNADDSPSDRRRTKTLNGKVQQRQEQKQKQKQSRGEGDVKSKRDVEFGADTGTGTGGISGSGTERPSKKRKRSQVDTGGANLDRNADSDADTNADAPSKSKKRKRKLSEDVDSVGDTENKDAKSPKHKTRYILFIGNLKYTTTKEAIQAHFAHIDPPPTIRLLTPKPSSAKSSTTAKSKGCAFLEFTSRTSLQHALKLHHSTLDGRQINVELTAGGGGKSSTRLEKLKGRNRKLEVQRSKHLPKSTVDPTSDPTTSTSQGQRHSSTSGTSELPQTNKRRTWSVPEAGDEDATHRGGSKKQRGLKKRKDKNLGTGVNSIPVG
ncbi:hypothetical protein ACEPAG_427 [Sanghuangporus baumii]